MEIIEPGKFVALSYDLYDITDGKETLLHQVPPTDPEKMVYGVTPSVIEPLMEAIKGLKKGDDFVATVSPAEGFGEYNDEMLRTETLPREIFEADGKLDEEKIYPGAQIYLQTNFGQDVPAVVLEVNPDTVSVKVDFNHPLAGRTVKLKGKVEEVRQASAEELAACAAQSSCGCGGGNCGGSCGDCGCDGGCGN